MAFGYDGQLAEIVLKDAESIAGVVGALQAIDAIADGSRDGLKWFNSLYLEVTLAVEARIAAGTFDDPQGTTFIANLDPVFANFYFAALRSWLVGREAPGSWSVFFEQRSNAAVARIQFALAGVNAHINRDLAVAITVASKKGRHCANARNRPVSCIHRAERNAGWFDRTSKTRVDGYFTGRFAARGR